MENIEQLDFYSKTNFKSYNLDDAIRHQLSTLDGVDSSVNKHSENVANLTCKIAEYLNLNHNFVVHATTCAFLHDIGKINIPSQILRKEVEDLTPEEFNVYVQHVRVGTKLCMEDLKLRPFANGPLYHHELLDGSRISF